MSLIYRGLAVFADTIAWNYHRKEVKLVAKLASCHGDQDEKAYWTHWSRKYERLSGNWSFQARTLRTLFN